MFNDMSCGSRDNEKECMSNANLVSQGCREIWERTMVIHWSWFFKEVVLYQWRQSTRRMGQNGGEDVVFQGFNTLQLSEKVKTLLRRIREIPENFTGRIIFMSMVNDITCGSKDNEKNASQMLDSFLFMQEDLEQDNGHLMGLVLKRSGTVSVKIVPQREWTIRRRKCYCNSQKANIQFSVVQVHCPEVDSKAKVMENCRYTIVPIWKRLRLFFAQLLL